MEKIYIYIAVFVLLAYFVCVHTPRLSYFSSDQDVQLYYFYMPTCPHCIRFDSEWNDIEYMASFRSNVTTTKVNTAKNPALANKFNVGTVPTVVKVVGSNSTVYTGDRTARSIMNWL